MTGQTTVTRSGTSQSHQDSDHETLLLLLSRDLRFADEQPSSERTAAQLPLPGVDPPRARPRRRPRRQPTEGTPTQPSEDPLLAGFARRLASYGRARKGQRAYLYQMRSVLAIAVRLTGRRITCTDLVRDQALLGRVLVDELAPTMGTRVSQWTLAQRRSALRDFSTLMRPELQELLGHDPHEHLDQALRGVAERVGAGYRLGGGRPRRRGGRAPTEGQIRDVLDVLGQAPGYLGTRNRAFFTILAETGARVNALRLLDGEDCVQLPGKRLRVFLYEKGKAEAREVELSRAATEAVREYGAAFNYLAASRRWGVRVRIGEPGAVWRNSPRGCWSYAAIVDTLRAACRAAEVPPYAPHALRRAFATDAASIFPRHTVAQAGGWQGLERLDDHYVQPREEAIRDKLARGRSPFSESRPSHAAVDGPVNALP